MFTIEETSTNTIVARHITSQEEAQRIADSYNYEAANGVWNERNYVVTSVPAGLTSLDPIPYGERRWNGAVWAPIQVDRYNAELSRIASRHQAGMDVRHLVDGLYNLAAGFDYAGKP